MNLGAENNRFDTIFCNTLDVENGIMGGGGVKQTTLYTWDGTTVSTNSVDVEILYLSEDVDKFDYLVVTASANDTKRHSSVVIDCSSIDWSNFAQYYIDFGRPANTDDYYLVAFYINLDNNNKKCQYFAETVGSNYTSTHIQSVIGIKYIDPDITNATSLDETLLYSGNDPITATTGSTAYTLSDDITNFDYIIIEVEGNQQNATNLSTTRMCSSQELEGKIINYSCSIGEHRGDNYTTYFDGWVTCATSEDASTTTIRFALRDKTSNINSVILKSVVGIKKNSLSTADIAEMAMPSSVYTTINLSATTGYFSGATIFTAPANGWVEATVVPASNSAALLITSVAPIGGGFGGGYRVTSFVPIKKNDTITIYMGGGTSSSEAKFFYSVGDAKALGLI